MRSGLVELQLQLAERRATNSDNSTKMQNTTKVEDTHPPQAGVSASLSEPLADGPRKEPLRPSARPPAVGVNVFGDWAATTGLAQAARRLTVAMHEAGIDLSLGTFEAERLEMTARVPERSTEPSDDRKSRDRPVDVERQRVPGDHRRSPAAARGATTYSIGVWYWELTTFPDGLISQMAGLTRSGWRPNSFRRTFGRATDRPVHVVPAVVPELKGTGRKTRRISA